jgi:hypothetical protein
MNEASGVPAGHLAVLLLTLAAGSAASEPIHPAAPMNFIFFDRERGRIADPAFLGNGSIAGAQLKYTWRELEPERDRYELRPLLADLAFLSKHGKRLFIQLQDVTFEDRDACVPDYLREDSSFGGGVARQYQIRGDDESTARPDGWVARRWDPAVRARFIGLLQALGEELDGRIERINLPETAVSFGESGRLHPAGFSDTSYVRGVEALMTAARRAFPRSRVIQYANFMPGEWLPWTDHGYLRAIYAHADRIGVGVGGPDLLPYRKGQQSHSLPLIAGRAPGTVAALAVQWGNLDEKNPATGARVTVSELYRFARDRLRLDYIFWGTQEPYYSNDVLPFIRGLPRVPVRGTVDSVTPHHEARGRE